MRFPVTIRFRSNRAKIYARTKTFPYYRVSYTSAGKRRMQTFPAYPDALKFAKHIVKELAQGSQTAALTASQSRDALAAIKRLDDFFKSTGRRESLLTAVSEFADAAKKLSGRTLGDAVTGYLSTLANIQRKDLKEAVEEFLKLRVPLTLAPEGQRPQNSLKYAYGRELHLRKFASRFPNMAVSDLNREHLETFIGSLSQFSAKSRNHYRAAIRQFLDWSVRKDYLPAAHRLNEADGMKPENSNTAEVSFYARSEFVALLTAADDELRVLIAIGGMAGLRTAELLRLDWADVWHVPGHIEVTARKSKTRQRRLVEICPSLAAWLEPYRSHTNGKLWKFHEITFQEHFSKLCKQAKVVRRTNGLRHAFCSYHFALHANENLTAQQAGNSPAMIHAHYKGLTTKKEAEKWFAVRPPTSAENVIPLPVTEGV